MADDRTATPSRPVNEGTPGHENGRARGGDGRYRRTMTNAERDAEACRLVATGMPYRAISDILGYGGPGSAHRAVHQAYRQVTVEPAEQAVKIELENLRAVRLAVWTVLEDAATAGHASTVLMAADRLTRVSESIRRLLGLDAPAHVVAQVEADLRVALGDGLASLLEDVLTGLGLDPHAPEVEQVVATRLTALPGGEPETG